MPLLTHNHHHLPLTLFLQLLTTIDFTVVSKIPSNGGGIKRPDTERGYTNVPEHNNTENRNSFFTVIDAFHDAETLQPADPDVISVLTMDPLHFDDDIRALTLRIDGSILQEESSVDAFLTELTDRELTGYNDPFNTSDYFLRSCAQQVHGNRMITKPTIQDARKWQPYLGFRPLEVIRRTFENTTQLARLPDRLPMRRHVQGLYPFLNRKRLHETVATDTFFSSEKDISGSTCAQIFYGLTSHFMNVYGLRGETDGPQAFEEFARSDGIPAVVRSDNSKMQRWRRSLQDLLRKWFCRTEYTEPPPSPTKSGGITRNTMAQGQYTPPT